VEFLKQYSAAFEPKSVGTNHDYGSFVMRYNDFSGIKDKESYRQTPVTYRPWLKGFFDLCITFDV